MNPNLIFVLVTPIWGLCKKWEEISRISTKGRFLVVQVYTYILTLTCGIPRAAVLFFFLKEEIKPLICIIKYYSRSNFMYNKTNRIDEKSAVYCLSYWTCLLLPRWTSTATASSLRNETLHFVTEAHAFSKCVISNL